MITSCASEFSLKETMRAATSGRAVPPLLILVGQGPHQPMEWFKGKNTGNSPYFMGTSMESMAVDLSLKPVQ